MASSRSALSKPPRKFYSTTRDPITNCVIQNFIFEDKLPEQNTSGTVPKTQLNNLQLTFSTLMFAQTNASQQHRIIDRQQAGILPPAPTAPTAPPVPYVPLLPPQRQNTTCELDNHALFNKQRDSVGCW